MKAGRGRGKFVGLTAALVAGLLALHPLFDAFHFVVIDHRAATAHGTLAHSHDHARHGECGGSHEPSAEGDDFGIPAVSDDETRRPAAICGFDGWLFRNEEAGGPGECHLPAAALVAQKSLAVPLADCPRALSILFLAPKQSPSSA